MARKKQRKSRVRNKKHVPNNVAEEELKGCPHSFVFNRGQVGKNVSELVLDMRRVMEPFTARHLKVRRKNVLKDFVSVAGPLNVSHFMVFTKSDVSTNVRFIRLPRGPTLTFQVSHFCLSRDVISSLKRPHLDAKVFQQHPLLVMNNFSGEGMHIKLMQTMFQNMFPSINVNKVKLKTIRRCVLLNYDPDTKQIEMRHYNIRAVPSGVSRSVKKLIKSKVPDLGKYEDVSEFITRGDLSESEGEMDGPHNEVVLPQSMPSRGNMAAQKSAIRLCEIGPRLTLQLVKIEEGLADGNVLYHEFIQKTEAERKQNVKNREKRQKLKAERKTQQQKNVEAKNEKKDANKQRSLAGMQKNETDTTDKGAEDSDSDTRENIEYFTQEVGEAPDPELFPRRKHKAKSAMKRKYPTDTRQSDKTAPHKKVKFTSKDNKTGNFDSKQKGNRDNKKTVTLFDKLRRSKVRKEKRTHAKKIGKRANKPRKC